MKLRAARRICTLYRPEGLLIIGVISAVCLAGCRKGSALDAHLDPHSLAGMRQAHPTKLLLPGQAPAGSAPISLPERVTYLSDGKPLGGWMVQPKKDDRRPAVLLCHNGFALSQTDFELAQTFSATGFRVFLPTFRGEKGNLGFFEMFYGEVNDAAAAANYLANRSDVDSGRIYAAGFGQGATIVALLAEMSSRIRCAAACEPTLDLAADIARDRKPPWPETPFDWRNPDETDLRSPARHIVDLQCPLRIYVYDSDSAAGKQAREFVAEAARLKKRVTIDTPTDSKVTPVEAVVEEMIQLFESH